MGDNQSIFMLGYNFDHPASSERCEIPRIGVDADR